MTISINFRRKKAEISYQYFRLLFNRHDIDVVVDGNDDWLLNGTSGKNRLYRAMVFSNMTFNGRGSTENHMNNTHNTL